MPTATKSKSIYTSTGNTPYTLTAYFIENSTSAANNTSNITVRATLYSTRGAFNIPSAGTLSIYWHDNNTGTDTLKGSITVTKCGDVDPYYFGSKQVETTFDVSHKGDGTLSGYAIAKWEKSVSGYNNLVPATGNVSTDNTSLTNIARQATLSVSNTNWYINSTYSYNYSPTVGGYTYKLYMERSGYTSILLKTTNPSQSSSMMSSADVTLDFNAYSMLSSSEKKATVNLSLYTYNGNTQIGSKSTVSITLYPDQSYVPVITLSSQDTGKAIVGNNRTSLTLTGNNKRIINGWNTTSVTWSAASPFANITSRVLNGTTVTTSPTTLNNVSNSITMTATDSRGNSTTKSDTSVTFIAYETPTISPVVKRHTATDGRVVVTFSGTYYNINFGAESNSLTITWYVREKGTTTYTQGSTSLTYTSSSNNKSYTQSGTSIEITNPISGSNGLFDYQKAYEVKFVVTDKVTSYTIGEVLLTSGVPSLAVFKNKVKVNGALEVNNILVDYPIRDFLIYNNGSGSKWYHIATIVNYGSQKYADFEITGTTSYTNVAGRGNWQLQIGTGENNQANDNSISAVLMYANKDTHADRFKVFRSTDCRTVSVYYYCPPYTRTKVRIKNIFDTTNGTYTLTVNQGQQPSTPTGDVELSIETTQDKMIWESSFNANNGYVKFGDGTAICWKNMSTTVTINNNFGNTTLKYGSVDCGSMPITFKNEPFVTVSNNGIPWAALNYATSRKSSWGTIKCFYTYNLSDYSVNIQLFAIGRWV